MTMTNQDRRSNAPESEALGSDDVQVFENARSAVVNLKKTLDSWIVIGRAVVRARDIADRRGGRFAFQRLLDQQGIAPALGREWQSQKAQAHKLIALMENLGEVMAWHQGLSPAQQIQWSAPSTIWKHCPVFKKGDADDADAERPPSKQKQLEASLAKALQENHHLTERLKHSDGSLFDLKADSAEDIANVIVASVSAHKVEALVKALVTRTKRKAQKPAG
jgi:hypothetical protein